MSWPFVLVIYWTSNPLLRLSTVDHLYSLKRYGKARCVYYNAAVGPIPASWLSIKWDMIVFHDIFLGSRWNGDEYFQRMCDHVSALKCHQAVKIAIPQDEFYRANVLNTFIQDFNIAHVFSVSPPSEWSKIYRDVDRKRTQIHRVLTGYLEPRTTAEVERIAAAGLARNVDIGYRAMGRSWREAAWLGRHGLKKVLMGDAIKAAAVAKGLNCDISTDAQTVLWRYDWYRFLLSCRFAIGVEGGASILDWDGSVQHKTLAYIEEHPEATLEEIERECFPGRDGELALFALSPRHLECCLTQTCQILYEGEYDGVLEAGKHYIALRHDHANLDDVLDTVGDEAVRQRIVEAAYRDIVASGKYTYARFAALLIQTSLSDRVARHTWLEQLRLRMAQLGSAWRHALWKFTQWLWARLIGFWHRNQEWIVRLLQPFMPRPMRVALKAWLRDRILGLKKQ